MALVQRSNTRRTIILGIVLAAVLFGGGFYLYVQNRPTEVVNTTNTVVPMVRQRPIVSEFSDGVFSDPRFEDLVFQEPTVIDVGNIGKTNPFQPTF